MVPAEFIILSLVITSTLHLTEEDSLKEQLHELQELEEDRFLAEFNQTIQKDRQKSWHDRHIKHKTFTVKGKVLPYEKFQMHWLGPYHVIEI